MRFLGSILSVVWLCAVCGCSRDEEVIVGVDLTEEARSAARASGYRSSWFERDTLRICTWDEYFAPDVIASFEKALGVKVEIESYDSNEKMFEVLKSGQQNYDIVTPTSYIIPAMADAGLLCRLNHLHLPNVRRNFDRQVVKLLLDPKMTYNVPYALGYTGFHYDRNQLPADADPASFDILTHPALKGRTAIFDDMRETVGSALMCLGYSINSINPAEIDEAADLVIRWKRNAGRCDNSYYDEDIATGRLAVAMSFSYQALMSVSQAGGGSARADVAQDFSLPKGAFSISLDEFVVTADSRQKDLAYAFINYIYDPAVACVSMRKVCAYIPVLTAVERLEPAFRKILMLTADQYERGQVIVGFDNRPKIAELYANAWNRIMSAVSK